MMSILKKALTVFALSSIFCIPSLLGSSADFEKYSAGISAKDAADINYVGVNNENDVSLVSEQNKDWWEVDETTLTENAKIAFAGLQPYISDLRENLPDVAMDLSSPENIISAYNECKDMSVVEYRDYLSGLLKQNPAPEIGDEFTAVQISSANI